MQKQREPLLVSNNTNIDIWAHAIPIVPFILNMLLAESQLSIWYLQDWDLKAEQTSGFRTL